MEREYRKNIVGEVRETWKTDGTLIRADYDENGWSLTVGYPDITMEEISELQDGNVQASFTVLNDTLFLLFKIGKIVWMDAPFEPRLNPGRHSFPYFEAGKGAPLVLQIVDSHTGRLEALRVVGMGTVFSNRLHKVCRDLQKSGITISPAQNAYLVNRTYSEYPTTNHMLKTVNPQNLFMLLKE